MLALTPWVFPGRRQWLTSSRVQTSVHYPPIHRFTAYADIGARRTLPRTEAVAERILTLPLYPHLEGRDLEHVAEVIIGAVSAAEGASP